MELAPFECEKAQLGGGACVQRVSVGSYEYLDEHRADNGRGGGFFHARNLRINRISDEANFYRRDQVSLGFSSDRDESSTVTGWCERVRDPSRMPRPAPRL